MWAKMSLDARGRKMDEMAILARTCPLWPIAPLRLRSGQGRLREAQDL